jgi:uncharacterized protein (DUF433 family)
MVKAQQNEEGVDRLIERSDDVLGGTPVFAGTRGPVQSLLDYLEGGDRLDDFLDDFPTVSRSQAVQVLEMAGGLTDPQKNVTPGVRARPAARTNDVGDHLGGSPPMR